MSSRLLNIGEAAQAAGVSAKRVRHYEELGLLPPPVRTEAGYRQYGEREVSILRFIGQARGLGFSMPEIGELLGLWSDSHRASREVKAIARRHVDELERRMREMAEMKAALERLMQACHGDDDPHCAILEQLSAGSPAAPEPGSVELRAPRRRAGEATARAAEAAPPQLSNHEDLMAWTRQRGAR